MPQIQTLSGSERPVAPAVLGASERSLQGEEAVLRGQMAMGDAIKDVAGVAGNAALLIARVKNEKDIARADLVMRKTEADLKSSLEADPNPENWEKTAEAALQSATGEVFTTPEGAKMSPVVRQQLEQRFKAWAQDTTLSVRNGAQRQQMRNNDLVFAQAQAVEVAEGNLEGAAHYVEMRRSLGLISDSRATLEMDAVRLGVDKQLVARAINEDPHAAIEMLEDQTEGGRYRHFKNLSETDRITALRSAKNARETARAETTQGLAEDIYAGGLSAIGIDQRIDDAVAARTILPSQANNLKRLARGERSPEEQAAVGSQLWSAALKLKPEDADYIQQSMAIRAQLHGLAPEIKNPVLDALNLLDKDNVTEDVRGVYAALDRDFRANAFGNAQTYTQSEINRLPKKDRKGLVEGDPKDRAAYEAASARLFEYQRAMRQWLQANPKASFEDIQRRRAQLTATDTSKSLGALLIDDLTGARP